MPPESDITGSMHPTESPHDVSAAGLRPGEVVGQYKLLWKLGEGSYGDVWLAERRTPFVQRVALKIIKAGVVSTSDVARFQQERAALAVMNHPHVAKVFDGGITSPSMGSRAYIVMEYINGIPITSYCDRHRLTTRQRLELFVPVCEAVAHAHTKAIIHRDLKPSNVLVTTGDGTSLPVPKVIDFGIAKALSHGLTDDTVATLPGVILGTPDYMSPEQAAPDALDVDTRADVYSLGVLLYELLSGTLPFPRERHPHAGLGERLRVIREEDAPHPSTMLQRLGEAGRQIAAQHGTDTESLVRELKRDLGRVPLKAMRKARNERYPSPIHLAEDIHNYLTGKPLKAMPESALYRFQKFVKRRRGPVIAATIVLLTTILGIVGILIFAQQSNHNAQLFADMSRVAEARATQATAAEAEAMKQRNAATLAKADSDRQRAIAQLEAYVSTLFGVDASLAAGDTSRVRSRLDACPLHMRGWEWGWFNSRMTTSTLTISPYGGLPMTAVYSPDSSTLATSSTDGVVRLWSSRTGHLLCSLSGHTDTVYSLAFSSDGSLLVSGSADHTARLWNVRDGTALCTLVGHDAAVRAVLIDPSSKFVITGSEDGTARIWDTASHRSLLVLRGHNASITDLAYSAKLDEIATASDDHSVRLWSRLDGASLGVLQGHLSSIRTVRFSPNSDRLLTASNDGSACLWDADTQRSTFSLGGHRDAVVAAEFSPDGHHVVTASDDGTARVWDVDTGHTIGLLRGHFDALRDVCFSGDGKWIATASADGTARVWDASTGELVGVLRGHTAEVRTARFNLAGDSLVTASWDGTIRVWDVISLDSMLLRGHSKGVVFAGFSTSGDRIITISRDGTAKVWHGRDHTLLLSTPTMPHEGTSVSVSTDSKQLVCAFGHAGGLSIDIRTDSIIFIVPRHRASLTAVALSPNGTALLTASDDGFFALDGANTHESSNIIKGHAAAIRGVAWRADGKAFVTASADHNACLWRTNEGTPVLTLRHAGAVNTGQFSADGTMLVTSCDDGAATIWDASSGKELTTLRGHAGRVRFAAFSPNGKRLVTAGDDRTARVWDVESGKELAVLHGHEGAVNSALFSPDGTQIITASEDRLVRIWDSVPYSTRYAKQHVDIANDIVTQSADHEIPQQWNSAQVSELGKAPLTEQERQGGGVKRSNVEPQRRDGPPIRSGPMPTPEQMKKSLLGAAAATNARAWACVCDPSRTKIECERALADATWALSKSPDNTAFRVSRGGALMRLGMYEDAIRELQLTQVRCDGDGIAPPNALWPILAMCEMRVGHATQARECLKRAISASESNAKGELPELKALIGEATEELEGIRSRESK